MLLVPPGPAPAPLAVASPVGLQVLQPGLQVVQQVDLLAALRAVHVQQLAVVGVSHLPWGLSRTGPGVEGQGRSLSMLLAGCALPHLTELAQPGSPRLLLLFCGRGMEINQSILSQGCQR